MIPVHVHKYYSHVHAISDVIVNTTFTLYLVEQPVGILASRINDDSDLDELTDVTSRYPEDVSAARQKALRDDFTIIFTLRVHTKN